MMTRLSVPNNIVSHQRKPSLYQIANLIARLPKMAPSILCTLTLVGYLSQTLMNNRIRRWWIKFLAAVQCSTSLNRTWMTSGIRCKVFWLEISSKIACNSNSNKTHCCKGYKAWLSSTNRTSPSSLSYNPFNRRRTRTLAINCISKKT